MASVRAGAALALILLASAVLNTAIFPEVALVSPLSREVSTICGALFSVLVAVAAYACPAWIRERALSVGLLALLGASLILLCVGLNMGNDTFVMAGSPFGGIGMVWFSVLLGVALTRLPLREALVTVPAAYVLCYGVRLVLSLADNPLPLEAASLLYFAAIVGSYLLISRDVRGIMAQLSLGASPTVLDATNPSSFLPFSSFVYVTIFLFNAAYGFEMAQSGGMLPATGELLSYLPVALVLVAALARTGGPLKLDTLHTAATLLVLAGLLLVPLRTLPADALNLAATGPAVLLRAGSDVFAVLTYFLIAALGSRNPAGALAASAFAFSASWLGILCGALGQASLDAVSMQSPEALMLATVAVTFAFTAYNFAALRHRSFDGSVAAVVPAYVPFENSSDHLERPRAFIVGTTPSEQALSEESPQADTEMGKSTSGDDALIDRGCVAVANCFGLTERERDVLALLARGRTSLIIQRELTVSHNTVKSHVRHIYTKLGVHSQQELIDLVEREGVGEHQ